MKTTTPQWNVKKVGRLATSGKLRFDYPIQRAGNQWDELQKSLLIHSIIGNFPIPPVLFLKGEENNEDYVIDGKQRITNILDFISGVKDEEGNYPESAYALHEETPDVSIEGKEGETELAGLYFDELDSDIQSEILSATLQVQRIEDATDEDIEELFFRWNNGTPLTKQQKTKAKMGVQHAVVINDLQNHKFLREMAQFTPLQRRRSDDEAVILQTMMLMSGEPIESLVADKILDFAQRMRGADVSEIVNAVKDALDYLYDVNTTSPLFKKLHLPTLLIVAKKAKDENVDKNLFGAWVDDFALAINARKADKAMVKTSYKKHTGAGSVKRDKVLGRKKEMLKHFEKFQVAFAKQQEELAKEEEAKKLAEKAKAEKEAKKAEAINKAIDEAEKVDQAIKEVKEAEKANAETNDAVAEGDTVEEVQDETPEVPEVEVTDAKDDTPEVPEAGVEVPEGEAEGKPEVKETEVPTA